MTQVTIFLDGDSIRRIRTEGHAESADYGEDLVCAAISVLMTNTLISLVELAGLEEGDYDLEIDEEAALMDISLKGSFPKDQGLVVSTICRVFETGMKSLVKEEEYSPYISLQYRRWNDD